MANRADNFNRSDGAIGSPSDGGSAWVVESGTWQIASLQARELGNGTGCRMTLESSEADGTVACKVSSFTFGTSSATGGIIARYSDANNWLLLWFGSTSQARLYKMVSGSLSQVGSDMSGTFASNDIFSMVLSGSSVTCKQNGSDMASAFTVADLTSNTKHGLFTDLGASALFDDWSFTGGGGRGSSAPLLRGLTASPLSNGRCIA